VSYVADINGFKATVTYEGEAVYPGPGEYGSFVQPAPIATPEPHHVSVVTPELPVVTPAPVHVPVVHPDPVAHNLPAVQAVPQQVPVL